MSDTGDAMGLATLRGWPRPLRIGLVVALIPLALGAAALLPPIPQDPAFHDFADRRPWLGVPNFADVVSNLPFLPIAIWGWWVLGRVPAATLDHQGRLPYHAFFAGVAATTFGSGYYHLDPTTPSLFWDRLGITVIAVGLTAIFVTDRIDRRLGARVVLPLFLVAGLASVVHWRATELAGVGDLRFYGLVQFLPALAIPLICLLFPGRLTSARLVVLFMAWYGVAKLFEIFDHQIFDLLGQTVSGHTLKHLAAATACAMVPLTLRRALP
jgi:hypothetical protein